MRFLTVKLDKYGVKYNEDRRSGKITSYKKKEAKKKPYEGVAPAVKEEIIAPVPVPEVIAAVPTPEVISPIVVAEEE